MLVGEVWSPLFSNFLCIVVGFVVSLELHKNRSKHPQLFRAPHQQKPFQPFRAERFSSRYIGGGRETLT